MGLVSEFKEFAVKGNMVDLAIGIMLGAAFGAVVQSLVADIIMPPIGLFATGEDLKEMHWVLREGATGGPYASVEEAKAAGAVVITYGQFLNTLLAFLTVAFVLFLVIRSMNRLRRQQEDPKKESVPDRKTCPYCMSSIPTKATRCAHCTAGLDVPADGPTS